MEAWESTCSRTFQETLIKVDIILSMRSSITIYCSCNSNKFINNRRRISIRPSHREATCCRSSTGRASREVDHVEPTSRATITSVRARTSLRAWWLPWSTAKLAAAKAILITQGSSHDNSLGRTTSPTVAQAPQPKIKQASFWKTMNK